MEGQRDVPVSSLAPLLPATAAVGEELDMATENERQVAASTERIEVAGQGEGELRAGEHGFIAQSERRWDGGQQAVGWRAGLLWAMVGRREVSGGR